jgi:16S rRNA (cytosine1402-N4)-methyltransferase
MRSPSTSSVEDFSSALFPAGRPGSNPDGSSPVEGLRMAQDFTHRPVMVAEVVDLFAAVGPGVVVDGTVGGGGHAAALLDANPDVGVLGLDRDPAALDAASRRLRPFGNRVALRHARFGDLGDEVDTARRAGGRTWPDPSGGQTWPDPSGGQTAPDSPDGAAAGLAGVLLDLGVSSPQLDRADRGFSYRQDGPLDMRMDPTTGRTALELVNEADVGELAALFAANGEGRLAGRIARAIVAARPLGSTAELADVVSAAVPAALRRRGHPARRVFQAIRIAVNDELDELASALPAALDRLAPGGRLVVIAYHSGEDRLVKSAMSAAVTGGCVCPPGLPCVCGARPVHRLVFRGSRKASAAELAVNHRAESARLRAVERIDAEDGR